MDAWEVAWRALIGGLLVTYLVILVRLARRRSAGRVRTLLPHLFIFVGALIGFSPAVLGLSRDVRLRTRMVGVGIMFVGYIPVALHAHRAAKRTEQRVDGPPDRR